MTDFCFTGPNHSAQAFCCYSLEENKHYQCLLHSLLTLQTARSEVSHKQLFVLISTAIFHWSQSSDVKRYLRMENNSALKPSELICASKQGYAQCKLFHSSTWKVSQTHTIFLCFQQQEEKGGKER